ncbi:MAG: D-tyrosyl-tRNA(Tyr) deacylase [Deltaproteobacteria bacterium]|nr:MAG: D-tyrosyl-tRNA(Tyr) deacylase [Deltaproteobacteria bacterium]
MIALLQRVKEASVTVDDKIISEIDKGLVVLVGVSVEDREEDCSYLASKIPALRIFEDKEHKMNLSCKDISGQMLVISQFTLISDTQKGNRPSFSKAAKADKAEKLYNYFVEQLKQSNLIVKTGQFAKHMQVKIVNDGPVTFILNSKR